MNEYVNALLAWLGIPVTIPHVEISTGLSLSIIFSTLVLSMVLSTLATKNLKNKIKD
jgi:tellurite resistance protein TerC